MLAITLAPQEPANSFVPGAPVSQRLRIHRAGDPGRPEVEGFIRETYRQRYGAEVRHFAPALIGLRDEDGDLVAAADPPDLVFLPHLAGERAPYWNPDARGVFLGLTTSVGAGHLVLAALEGVAHAVRMVLEGCERAGGITAEQVRIAGGGARSPLWNQLKADIVGRPIDVLAEPAAGVLGSVFMGLVAAGLAPDVATLAEERARVSETIQPRAERRERADALHAVYTQSYRALEPLFPRLAALP